MDLAISDVGLANQILKKMLTRTRRRSKCKGFRRWLRDQAHRRALAGCNPASEIRGGSSVRVPDAPV